MIAGINASRSSVSGGGDIPWSATWLQLHNDGADGATTLVDSSSYGRTVTRYGTADSLVTADQKFGSASLSVAKVSWTEHGYEVLFGTTLADQFCLEYWARVTTPANRIAALYNGGSVCAFRKAASTSALLLNIGHASDTANFPIDNFAGTVARIDNAWYHAAVTVDMSLGSNHAKAYINGVQTAQRNLLTAERDSLTGIFIGIINTNAGSNDTNAFKIDEVRVTNGYTRYSGPFTPPVAAFDDF